MVKVFNDLKLDILFKFVFGPEDRDSLYLLRTLVEGVLHRGIGQINHKNVEYIRKHSKEKGVRYDILFANDILDKFNIEMQNTSLTQSRIKRFGLYAAKLVNDDVEVGDEYENLKTNVQIILMNQESDSFIKTYIPKDEDNKIEGEEIDMNEENSLIIRYYVFLPCINELLEEKRLEDFDDFEIIIYAIANGIDKVKTLDRKVVEMMERKIVRFNADEELLKIAYDRKIYLMTEEAEKKEIGETNLRKGREEGRALGHLEGKIDTILEMSCEIYPDYDCLWIKELDEAQLNYAQKLLCKQLSYDDFYKSVTKFVH